MKVKLQYVKSTKGTHVYSSKEEGVAIPTLYIKRDALPKNAPDSITVTVEYSNES